MTHWPSLRYGTECVVVAGALLALVGCGAPDAPPPTVPALVHTQQQPPSNELGASETPTAQSTQSPAPSQGAERTRFAADVALLEQHGPLVVLKSPEGGAVAVAPAYQARVMTSAVAADGHSLGWVNRRFIEAEQTGTQFDNYGGEDRFWLGPEGGQFGLYFAPGAKFQFDDWQTPNAFQQGPWAVASQSPTAVSFEHTIGLENYSRTRFDMKVERTIRLLDRTDVSRHLGVALGSGVQWVAFETDNRITNQGLRAWKAAGGLPSIWILGMYPPTPDTFVVVPFNPNGGGPVVNDEYFGKVPADRLSIRPTEHVVVFRCDGKHRSKIGLGPSRAMAVAGSYSASTRQLTIVQTERPTGKSRYVNSMWEQQRDPYAGDVINSYNDGPTEPGKPALGGFYELETSSPGAELGPGGSLRHVHRTFHFVGDSAVLDVIARAVLGVSVTQLAP